MDSRWFSMVERHLKPHLAEFAGRPITYVEIGCWAGASALWVAENVLTHPESRGFGIDPWLATRRHPQSQMDELCETARAALAPYPNFRFIRGRSDDVLRGWSQTYGTAVDLLYIDGDHSAPATLMDFWAAWPWLTPGAGVIFDDYGIGLRKEMYFAHVPTAVASIELALGNLIEPWGEQCHRQRYFKVRAKQRDKAWDDHQFAIRKADPEKAMELSDG